MHWIFRVGWCGGLLAVAPVPVVAQEVAAPVGDGLLGTYYQGRNFEQLRYRQVDATIDFYRRHQPPAEGVPAENFSARWTGWLRVPTSGRYVLHLDVDDGARLWLDGRLLLDEWRGQPLSSYTLDLNLQAGRAYALRLGYCQYGADSYAQLAWVRPEQWAQRQRAASWRTLWGLAADRPLPAVIPTRYLFSHNPLQLPTPSRPAPLVQQSRAPAPSRAYPLARRPPAPLRSRAVAPRQVAATAAAPASRPADSLATRAAAPRLATQLALGQALVWPNLYFAQGQAGLLPAARASLDTLVTVLRQQPGLRLQVQGHTDNQGDSVLNRQLSQRRAEAVCRYLVLAGIAEGRLQARGYGGTCPVADNRVVALRARNRRVVLQPLP